MMWEIKKTNATVVRKLQKQDVHVNKLQCQKTTCREPKQNQAKSAWQQVIEITVHQGQVNNRTKTNWPTSSTIQQVIEITVHQGQANSRRKQNYWCFWVDKRLFFLRKTTANIQLRKIQLHMLNTVIKMQIQLHKMYTAVVNNTSKNKYVSTQRELFHVDIIWISGLHWFVSIWIYALM